MTPLTDDELISLLDDLESDRAERKQSWAGDVPDRARQAVCAFANDLPNHQLPSVLFIGVKDDGNPSKIEISDRLLLTIADIKTDGRTLPPPTLTVQKRNLKGADVAVVTVWPADAPPVIFEGRIWIRIGPRRGIATAQDERVLAEKRRFRDLHFEAHPVSGTSTKDLNEAEFVQEYLPSAFAEDVLSANGRSVEMRMASCGMVAAADDPVPTVLGLLVLGTSPRTWVPGSYVEFLRIKGSSITDSVIDEKEIDGTISAILRNLDEKLNAYLTSAVDFTSQDREVRVSPYPLVALQQLARNAVMHRTYEGTNAPVRFYWYDDRIEILNPGGGHTEVLRSKTSGNQGDLTIEIPSLLPLLKS